MTRMLKSSCTEVTFSHQTEPRHSSDSRWSNVVGEGQGDLPPVVVPPQTSWPMLGHPWGPIKFCRGWVVGQFDLALIRWSPPCFKPSWRMPLLPFVITFTLYAIPPHFFVRL